MSRKAAARVLAVLGLAALLGGCANTAQTTSPTGTTPGTIQFPQTNANTQNPYSPLSSLPDDVKAAIPGTYDGTIYKMVGTDFQPQKVVISITQDQIVTGSGTSGNQAQPYFTMSITSPDSNGPFGALSLSNLYLGSAGTWASYYAFGSNVQRLTNFYDYPFSVELYAAVASGQKSPTQTLIYIKDCGFSPVSTCSKYSQSVGFGGDLRKRQ